MLKDRLKILINILGLNLKDFSRKTGIPYPTLQDYLAGKIKPGSDNLEKISMVFHVNLNWLLTGKGEVFEKAPVPEAFPSVVVPVLGRVPAGFPDQISEAIIEHISLPHAPHGSYALITKGDSMSPAIKDGDYVLFMPNGEVRNGDVVVVNNEWGDTMLKRYREKDGEVFLTSDNSEYPSLKPNKHYRIIGKVIGVWRKIKI